MKTLVSEIGWLTGQLRLTWLVLASVLVIGVVALVLERRAYPQLSVARHPLLLTLGVAIVAAGLLGCAVFEEHMLPLVPSHSMQSTRSGAHDFVRISVRDLRWMFDNRDPEDSRRLGSVYIGQWMRLTCQIADINYFTDGTTRLICNQKPVRWLPGHTWFHLSFVASEADAISRAEPGDTTRAACRIAATLDYGLRLDQCEVDQ